jgi:ribose transport system ATP-binding protein
MHDNILEMKGIEKCFSQVKVLKDVDFLVKRGEVRALVGANGAGKSTLMKILGGDLIPNKGEIVLNGEKVNFHSPKEAINRGVSIIYQELSLIPTMSIYENVYLNRERTKYGILQKNRMKSDYEKLAGELKFGIPANVKASSLNIANQQLVEIMKALSIDADIIVMDEPTTSLTESEKEKLYETIKSLKQRGKTIIYISHLLREIFQIADNITIMRDGEIVGSFRRNEITQMEVAGLVMNKSMTAVSADRERIRDLSENPVVLKMENITKAGVLNNINLVLKKGEILGLAGLLGAGRTELCRTLCGDLTFESGQIVLNGKKCRFKQPKDAIRAGIGFIPEDRKNMGLILKHPAYSNSTIVCLNNLSKFGIVSKRKQFNYANRQVSRLNIKVSDIRNPAGTLSGGNQQKIVISKWSEGDFQIYVFDEPTKGIDVGAKEEIFRLVEMFTEGGASVIFVSSDLEEVLRISDRIMVMSKGRITKEFEKKNFDLQKIMAFCMDISEEGDIYAG